MADVTLLVAFLAGLVSFLAPCVLPLVPGYLAYLAGSSLDNKDGKRLEIFINSLFFVLGFSLLFAALGILLNTILRGVAYEVQTWLSRLGGIIIIIFGLYLTGLLRLPFLDEEHKVKVPLRFSSRYITSFMFGFAFAAGWTPCAGAILGSIIGLAASYPASAFSLLMAYALGLGLPFILISLFAAQASSYIQKINPILPYLNIAFGILLIIIGVLVFTDTLTILGSLDFVNRWALK
jgi:cytochrome c-type biogenesis protein